MIPNVVKPTADRSLIILLVAFVVLMIMAVVECGS